MADFSQIGVGNAAVANQLATASQFNAVMDAYNNLVTADDTLAAAAQIPGVFYNIKKFGALGDGSTDDLAAFNLCATAVSSAGGGIIVIPESTGDYQLSGNWALNFSNVIIVLQANLDFTNTAAANGISFIGTNGTNLTNVGVVGNLHTIQGNGSNVIGFSYVSGTTNQSAVRMDYVDGFFVRDITVNDGLVNNVLSRFCKSGIVDNVTASNANYDNGISINAIRSDWAQDDFSTYNNITVRDSKAFSNIDYGMTAFSCAGVSFVNCKSWANGNSDVTQYHNGGGGFSFEDSSASPNTRRYRGAFTNCHASKNEGKGFTVTADEVQLLGCSARDTFYNGADASNLQAHGLYIVAAKDVTVDSGEFSENAKSGIRAIDNASYEPEMYISNTRCNSNSRHGINAQNCALVKLDNVETEGNTLQGINGPNNGISGTGAFYGSDLRIANNASHGLVLNGHELAVLADVAGWKNATSAGVGCRFLNVTTLDLADVHMFDSDGNQSYGVEVQNTVTNLWHNGNVGGDGTTANFSNSATNSNRKQGTATVAWNATSIVVTHGLIETPVAGDISIVPIETLNSASFFWVDTLTATQFTINVDVNPGTATDFAWSAVVR